MVRINLINPANLTDQHLIAEYDEILMLIVYVKKFSEFKEIPDKYCLGKGHIKFFKNKLLYIKKRHESIKKEMKKRGFATNKTVNIDEFPKMLLNNYKPTHNAILIIKRRISEKLKMKPDYYRHY